MDDAATKGNNMSHHYLVKNERINSELAAVKRAAKLAKRSGYFVDVWMKCDGFKGIQLVAIANADGSVTYGE